MNFLDIERFTDVGNYEVNMPLSHLERSVDGWEEEGLEMNPDFQRGHVWTEDQQIAYVEFFLRGGMTNRVIYFNHPSWMHKSKTSYNDFVLVDGLQRITALLRFLRNEIKVFGTYLKDFEGELGTARSHMNLKININQLQTKKEVLNWYIEMNTGGVVHTDEEINRVKILLENEQ